MIETYKIMTAKYDQEVCEGIFKLSEEQQTWGHVLKIFKQRSRLNIRKYSFVNRVIDRWNSLPEYVINAETVIKFENNLDKVWSEQDIKYKSSWELGTGFTGLIRASTRRATVRNCNVQVDGERLEVDEKFKCPRVVLDKRDKCTEKDVENQVVQGHWN